MKTNNLNRCLLSIAVATSLTACGGPEEGFKYENGENTPVSMDSNTIAVSLTETHDENDANRYQQVDLLQGVEDQNVFILDIQKLGLKIQPGDRDSLIDEELTKPVLVSGTNLVIDTFQFANEIHTGETFEYQMSYWVDNGFDFPCADMSKHPANCTLEEVAANPNRRTITISVNAIPDPLTDISLADFSVGLNDTMAIPVMAVPSYAADANYIWETTGEQGVVSIGDNNQITGLKIGTTQLKVTAQSDTSITKTVMVDVTNPPKNVAEIKATTLNGDMLPATITLTDCTQFDLKVMAEKTDANAALTGDFVYTATAENNQFMIDGFTANSGAEQTGYLTSSSFGTSDTLTISLNGFNGDTVTLPVETAENLACNYTDTDSAVPLLNEDFLVYHSKGTVPAFVISDFIKNGEGDDATVDASAAVNVVGTGGKNDSGALQYTANGTAKGGFNSYHKNSTRFITPDLAKVAGKYLLSFWAKNQNADSITVEQYISASTNTKSAAPVAGAFGTAGQTFESTHTLAGSTDWQQFSIEVDIPDIAPSIGPKWEIIITPNQTDGSTPVDILFDDFSVSPINN